MADASSEWWRFVTHPIGVRAALIVAAAGDALVASAPARPVETAPG